MKHFAVDYHIATLNKLGHKQPSTIATDCERIVWHAMTPGRWYTTREVALKAQIPLFHATCSIESLISKDKLQRRKGLNGWEVSRR